MHEDVFRGGRHDGLGELTMLPYPAISCSRANHLLDSNIKELVRRCPETANSKTPRFSGGRG